MWLNAVDGKDKWFYTTGRLTSEMVIKVAQMQIPILLSRSGVTFRGLELAQKIGVVLIARAKGRDISWCTTVPIASHSMRYRRNCHRTSTSEEPVRPPKADYRGVLAPCLR